jgi:hypothetical protein
MGTKKLNFKIGGPKVQKYQNRGTKSAFKPNFYFNYKLSDKKNYIYKCVAFKMFLISLVSFN